MAAVFPTHFRYFTMNRFSTRGKVSKYFPNHSRLGRADFVIFVLSQIPASTARPPAKGLVHLLMSYLLPMQLSLVLIVPTHLHGWLVMY